MSDLEFSEQLSDLIKEKRYIDAVAFIEDNKSYFSGKKLSSRNAIKFLETERTDESRSLFKTLVEHNLFNDRIQGVYLLMYLIQKKQTDYALDLLKLDKNIPLQDINRCALSYAINQGDQAVIDVLLKQHNLNFFMNAYDMNIDSSVTYARDQILSEPNEIFRLGGVQAIHGMIIQSEFDTRNEIEKPLVFLSSSEFSLFIYFLKMKMDEGELPISEKFIIHGGHWQHGEIRIGKDNMVSVFFNDSVPEMSNAALFVLQNVFSGHHLEVYCCREKMQRMWMGCSFFALDGAKRLYNIHKYLPSSYGGDIFKYFEKQVSKNKARQLKTFDGGLGGAYACDLPLNMMQTMQSTRYVTDILPSRGIDERLQFINKKKQLPKEAWAKDYVVGKDDEYINEKIMAKIASMQKKAEKHCRSFTAEQMSHVLAGYKLMSAVSRINSQTKQSVKLDNRKKKRGG